MENLSLLLALVKIDLAAQEHDTYGVMASDIVENMGRAIHDVVRR